MFNVDKVSLFSTEELNIFVVNKLRSERKSFIYFSHIVVCVNLDLKS